MKWSEKGSEILSRAGGFPRPLFSSGRRPYIQVGTAQQSHALHWGIPPDPFFFRALPCGGYPQTPSEGQPSDFSINPNPFFIRRGFEPLPKPLANHWQGDVIDYGQRPPSVKGFLYGSQSLCPFGASHGLFTSPLSPPLEKGLKEREAAKRRKDIKREGSSTEETTSTAKASNGKGAQFADYAKRWSVKGI